MMNIQTGGVVVESQWQKIHCEQIHKEKRKHYFYKFGVTKLISGMMID